MGTTWTEYATTAADPRARQLTDFDRVLAGAAARDTVLADPLLREYNRRPPTKLKTVADVMGHRLRWVDDLTDQRVRFVDQKAGTPISWPGRNSLAAQILAAVPYLWTGQVMDMVRDLTLPSHVIAPDVLPFPLLWWTFDEVLAESPLQWRASALMVKHEVAGSITAGLLLLQSESATYSLNGTSIKYGSRYPDDFMTSDARLWSVTLLLSMLSFVNSPYIPKDERRLERDARKWRERAGIPPQPENEIVRFVDLRPAERDHQAPADDAEPGRYSVRWVVRGHHRAQWYPSLGAHKVIWIAPYVKGSPDAPLKSTTYRVMR